MVKNIIAVANQKGGCGKTTTAINLAASLGRKERRVLLIDMDSQGHATLGLGIRSADLPGLYEVFAGHAGINEVILDDVVQGVDLLPGSISLAALEHTLADLPEREKQLVKQIPQLKKTYDYIIIDCPPALGLLSVNALRASTQIIIPVEISYFAFEGIERLRETIDLICTRYDLDIPVQILPCMVDMRTCFTKERLEDLKERFRSDVSPVYVRTTIRVREAAYHGKSLLDYAPHAVATSDYQALAERLIADEISREIIQSFSARDMRASRMDTKPTLKMESSASQAIARQFQKKQREPKITVGTRVENDGTHKVIMSYHNYAGQDLQIAGDFNNWIPDYGVETRVINDTLQKVLNVYPGAYQYRVIIDGEWQEDPANPNRVPNHYGGANSLLRVLA